MYRQRPIKGGRLPMSAALMGKIWNYVNRDARHFDVGRSFVVATILAYHYNVKEQEDYKTVDKRGRK